MAVVVAVVVARLCGVVGVGAAAAAWASHGGAVARAPVRRRGRRRRWPRRVAVAGAQARWRPFAQSPMWIVRQTSAWTGGVAFRHRLVWITGQPWDSGGRVACGPRRIAPSVCMVRQTPRPREGVACQVPPGVRDAPHPGSSRWSGALCTRGAAGVPRQRLDGIRAAPRLSASRHYAGAGATSRSRAAARPAISCGTSSASRTNRAGVHEPLMS